jgi:hypothetical protein
MERFGRRFVSPVFTRDEFINLKLDTNSDWHTWNHAIKIFEDRIQGRFFDSIKILLEDENKNGFAIMALNCLLIETLQQFIDGVNSNLKSKQAYTNFLRKELTDVFDIEEKADMFYRDIRCGILHSAQTKNGSRLTFGKSYIIEVLEGNKVSVDVGNFSERLWIYFRSYIDQLEQEEELYIRQNFIKKMKHICRYEEN